jgi:hypothetical protein
MLTYRHHDFLGEERLSIATRRGEAWIAKIARHNPEMRDWELWVRHHPGDAARTAKSPLRLEIEKELRHYIFRRYKRHLFALDFGELSAIALREAGSSARPVSGSGHPDESR